MSSKDNFDVEIFSKSNRLVNIKITALREVDLYKLAEALWECSIKKESYASFEVEYNSSDGEKTYHFTNHTLWVNPVTVLSDISKQIKM